MSYAPELSLVPVKRFDIEGKAHYLGVWPNPIDGAPWLVFTTDIDGDGDQDSLHIEQCDVRRVNGDYSKLFARVIAGLQSHMDKKHSEKAPLSAHLQELADFIQGVKINEGTVTSSHTYGGVR